MSLPSPSPALAAVAGPGVNAHDEAEKSFFALAKMDQLAIDDVVIEHNLSKWNLKINACKIKGDRIHLDIGVPYAEINLELEEKEADPAFFHKNTARLRISSKVGQQTGALEGLIYKGVPVQIKKSTKCLIFDTPYMYPHNWYTLSNHKYLHDKILFSLNYMEYFLRAYRSIFTDKVPLIYVSQTRESKDEYEIDVVIKDYMTISYIKTDINTATIHCHVLIEKGRMIGVGTSENNQNSKYHLVTVKIPRDIRSGNVYFKFVGNFTS